MPTFEELKGKYAAALSEIHNQGVKVEKIHLQDNKLHIKGAAPSEEAKNEVWKAIKAADPTYGDLVANIVTDTSLPKPAGREQSYTVQAGDTLSKISQQFYGDAKRYMKIFEANKGTLSDPDKIKPGQVLKIPAA
jgi:nucleoid-associated protein YgaU